MNTKVVDSSRNEPKDNFSTVEINRNNIRLLGMMLNDGTFKFLFEGKTVEFTTLIEVYDYYINEGKN